MALSSLFLWKSNWLAAPAGFLHGFHGTGVVVGVAVSVAVLLWCLVSRSSLRKLGVLVVPAICFACLLASCLPTVDGTSRWMLGVIAPVVGSYALVFAWLYVVAMRDIESSLFMLLLSWVISFFVRTFFESFSGTLATWAVSVVLMAACWGLLLVQVRQVASDTPMATSSFASNRTSYLHGVRSFWRSALYCGAFAFLGGLVRFLAVDTEAMTLINYCSALAGLLAPIVLMVLWRFRTVRYNIDGVFRLAFPLLVISLGLLPFVGSSVPFLALAALLYMTYSFLSLSLQALSIQIAHDYGIDPVFCFSFQTLVCLLTQGAGYALGACAPIGAAFGVPPLAVMALGSVCFLALVLYGTRAFYPSKSEESRPVEFLSLALGRNGQSRMDATPVVLEEEGDVASGEKKPMGSSETMPPHYEDKTALRCDLIGRKYALSQREMEIMLLFARGNTISSVAEELFISENTVKTHMRRLYMKLGIHKKQELFALINSHID